MTLAAPNVDPAARVRQPMSRAELLTLVSAIMALMAVAIDMMLPAFDDIRDAFDLKDGSGEVGQVITVFFLGLALAQLFYGPLADRYGRKPVLYSGIAIYLIGAVGSALAPTFELLLLSRFVWGIGAAGARVVATAIVRDRFVGLEMARAMSRIMAVFVLVPVLAPAVGAAVIAVVPWRGVFWFCVVFAAAITAWTLRLGETLDPANRRELSIRNSIAGYVRVARTPVTGGYTAATIFLQSVFTAYLAASETIISDIFGREKAFPFVFGAVAVGFGLGAVLNGFLVGKVGVEGLMTRVLAVQLPFAALLTLIALSADGRPNFWFYMPVLAVILSSFMFLMPNLNAAAMVPVGDLAGTASAFGGAVRMAAGAVLGTIISNQVVDTVTGFSIGLLLCCAAAAATISVVRVRARQRGQDLEVV